MNLGDAVRAAAPRAPHAAIDGLEAARTELEAAGAFESPFRMAHIIGQCAHESMDFNRVAESLHYTTPGRLLAVWPRRFEDESHAATFTRNAEKLANHVYGGRMGNDQAGDGYRFRGRGYLQLTGRDNYRVFGERIGLDLISAPEKAEDPAVAWRIAASYFANRSRRGKTALEWADENDVYNVTRIVNGGEHGLADRRDRTARALAAMGGIELRPVLRLGAEGDAVLLLQTALARAGFSPGALDGDFGPRTETALKAFQAAFRLPANGIADADSWETLATAGPMVPVGAPAAA